MATDKCKKDDPKGRGLISQVGGRPGNTVKGSVDEARFRESGTYNKVMTDKDGRKQGGKK